MQIQKSNKEVGREVMGQADWEKGTDNTIRTRGRELDMGVDTRTTTEAKIWIWDAHGRKKEIGDLRLLKARKRRLIEQNERFHNKGKTDAKSNGIAESDRYRREGGERIAATYEYFVKKKGSRKLS